MRTKGPSATPVDRSSSPVTRPFPGLRVACAGLSAAGAVSAALDATVPGSTGEELVPFGVSGDGRTGYASAWTPGFSGVAAVDLRTGALRRIMRFSSPGTDQADGAWGGRWLVWEQTYSLQSLDRFTVYAWDSAAGVVRRLGGSLASRSGVAWPSPWHAPAVRGDYAAWAQGYGPGGLVQIRLADLATGRVRVVAHGHDQAPFFDGDLLVWPESDRPGALTTLHGYSVAHRRVTALPAVLQPVAGTDFVVTDGTRTAYLSPGLNELYYSPDPGQPAHVVLRLSAGTEFSALAMGQGVLAWTTTQATYVGSTATGRAVQVTPAYGLAVTGSGSAVLVADAPTGRSAHPSLPLHVIQARNLDTARRVPRCDRPR